MKQDFLILFEHLKEVDVSEHALYNLLDEAHKLIQMQFRNSVPNTCRKFYECILYRCEQENKNIKLKYHDEGSRKNINLYGTSHDLFKKDSKFLKDTIKPFLEFVNKSSHCNDANYAKIKKPEIYKCIEYIIDIWNWYATDIRKLDEKYIIKNKHELPEPIDINMINAKIESDKAKIKTLREQLAEKEAEQESESADLAINMETLENDIEETIKDFISKGIYCTHKTIALFLLGDRIAQTDFANLSEMELFGKYSKNKFSQFEYDLALQNLIQSERIIQVNVYFYPFDKNMNSFDKLWIKLSTKFNIFYKINKKIFKTKINQKYIDIIQKAIDENKKIKVKYYKSIPNTTKKEVTERILIPKIMVPKENKDDIYKDSAKNQYSEQLYYLGATDEKDNQLKTFRLDGIKNPKII